MKWTLRAFQRFSSGTDGTLGQLRLGRAGDTLEVVVARVAEVGRAEAEVDGHGAAVATLVLEEVGSVFGAHLEKRGTCENATTSLTTERHSTNTS